jgi:hypothetical protein
VGKAAKWRAHVFARSKNAWARRWRALAHPTTRRAIIVSSSDHQAARARSLVSAAGCAWDLPSAFSLLPLKRGAERRKAQGFANPLRRTRQRACSRSFARTSRLSALHHGVFAGPCPTHLGPRLLFRATLRVHPAVQQCALLTGHLARKADPEAPREPSRPAEPAGAVPASYQSRPAG